VIHPGCRIARWRPKASPLTEIVLLPPPADKRRAEILGRVRSRLEGVRDFAGFAFVVWERDGASSTAQHVWSGAVTRMAVPDFVRERLAAETILQWAAEDVREMLGIPPPDTLA